MTEWSERAWRVIGEVHKTLPHDISLAERKKAIDAAYPFGDRSMWPYKAWLKARKNYLTRYGYGPPLPIEQWLSPLDRAKTKSVSLPVLQEKR